MKNEIFQPIAIDLTAIEQIFERNNFIKENIDDVVVFMPQEDDDNELGYIVDLEQYKIAVQTSEFTTSERSLSIELIDALTSKGFEVVIVNEQDKDVKRYCENCTNDGYWKEGFIDKFEELKEVLDRIVIQPLWFEDQKKAFIMVEFDKIGEVHQFFKEDDELYVTLETKDGEEDDFKVCDVVWEAFKGKIPNGYMVTHIDGDKTNNELTNLKLIKISEAEKKKAELEKQKEIMMNMKMEKSK